MCSGCRARAVNSRTADVNIRDGAYRVLRLPGVADKTFLITIGDRSVTGMVTRDQMVGPWQVPVADVAVTASDYVNYTGEAMAMGERTPVALLNGPASGRMAVGEAVTNIAAAGIADIGRIRLSANWMAPAGHPGEDASLYDTVRAVGEETLSGARYCHSGRQGFHVDEIRLERGGGGPRRDGAAVADRFRVRARDRCAPDADAAIAQRPG